MLIQEITAKSILTQSKIPGFDYCVNPYVGCSHRCVYCYARFMRRFTGHSERWGTFVDVKANAMQALQRDLSRTRQTGRVVIGSVTDAYQPVEGRWGITRSLLELLLAREFPVSILTKSSLVLKDVDLLQRFADCEVGLTITTTDDAVRRAFEPGAARVESRIRCLEELHRKGLRTRVFVGPILPLFTDLRGIFEAARGKVDEVWGESLNLKCGNWWEIRRAVREVSPDLLGEFEARATSADYWAGVGQELRDLSEASGVPLGGYVHHGGREDRPASRSGTTGRASAPRPLPLFPL